MRQILLLAALVGFLAMPVNASDPPIATGHIQLGHPGTALVGSTGELAGEEGIDSFSFDPSPYEGQVLKTVTTSNLGLPYDIDIYFYNANGFMSGTACTADEDEWCLVPATATIAWVDAYEGADLDVEVYLFR